MSNRIGTQFNFAQLVLEAETQLLSEARPACTSCKHCRDARSAGAYVAAPRCSGKPASPPRPRKGSVRSPAD